MKSNILSFLLLCLLQTNMIYGQRPSYAGSRPQNGYKDRLRPNTDSSQQEIVSRFDDDVNRIQRPPVTGSEIVQPAQNFIPINNQISPNSNRLPDINNRNSIDSSTSRLPYDALGDRELIERLNRLPIDQRPFWYINAQAIEAHRNRSANQIDNFNPIAQRGSFAGSGSLNNFNPPQTQQIRQQPSLLGSRGDFGSVSALPIEPGYVNGEVTNNNVVDQRQPNLFNRANFNSQTTVNRQRFPSNNIQSANLATAADTQNGRFVYVTPQLYNALRNANLVS